MEFQESCLDEKKLMTVFKLLVCLIPFAVTPYPLARFYLKLKQPSLAFLDLSQAQVQHATLLGVGVGESKF